MNPSLIAIAGQLKGKSLTLGEESSIGRDASNWLSLDDIALSRWHCIVKKEGEHFKILDLDSHNGTFINDVPIKERVLEHGDRIRVGNSLLLFITDAAASLPVSQQAQLDYVSLTTKSAIRLPIEDVLCAMARDLSALLKISTTINPIRGVDSVQRQLLESLFEVVPAERAAILLFEEGQSEPAEVFTRDIRPESGRTLKVSRTIIQQVLREGFAVLSNDLMENVAFSHSESLIASQTKSLICVPVALSGKIIGVIYVDTSNPRACFNESHLQMVTAIAGIAAGALVNARLTDQLKSENQRLQADLQIESNMIGESPRMREVYQIIAKAAPTDSNVLILGESGTGKELAARAIHHHSGRAGKQFVAINCATLAEALLESELFGHEKGAFTGAIAQKRGKVEFAHGGTLFLDEIAELSLVTQAKLLRVLQEREFERVGGTHPIQVDVRLIAATNKDLERALKDGSFRQDLYYRLNVISLVMPPLRERRQDIPLLSSHFLKRYSEKCKRRVIGFSPQARTCLMNYDWPGNVRELENAIERAVVIGSVDTLEPEDLPEAILEAQTPPSAPLLKYYESVKEAKKRIILKAIEEADGNYTGAAKLLGIHPNNLHRLVRNTNLRADAKKSKDGSAVREEGTDRSRK